ncbi:hypothetical protein GGP41_002781 [Bipolaris sorokiniana]|uniref:Aminoglycoside phosphotransferase domain-containing protein n=1 Tax=Cochliobolus sativus TaxID=45130 RepID=A0A8H5Z683_COCSA|nr:hypothetical protein GGP41_002781 [Bipolaris sorokiniana]
MTPNPTDLNPSDREHFELFGHNIATVASALHDDVSEVTIEYMRGGSYNRVTGVNITSERRRTNLEWFVSTFGSYLPTQLTEMLKAPKDTGISYIVRIPRFINKETMNIMARDVAILKTVGALVQLPVPRVVRYDLTFQNAIGKPYMIQTRLPGKNFSTLMKDDSLNTEQLLSIAEQVSQLAPIIAAVEGPGGNISLSALSSDSKDLHVESLHLQHEELGDRNFNLAEHPQDTFEHLIETCRRWSEDCTEDGQSFNEIWLNFGIIIKSLNTRGFLNGPCVLAHRDLMPYNLLAEIRNDTQVQITGVIDWDSATMAPEFVAYKAPFWLWTEDHVDSDFADTEECANIVPVTEDAKMIKQVFMENASEKYKHFAFAPEAILARRMYVILKEGIPKDWHIEEAWKIVSEWHALHPEDGITPPEEDSDCQLYED